MNHISLVTLNTNGLRSTLKRRAVFNELRKARYDVIFLQETHCTPAEEKIWLTEWGGPGYFSHGKSNARGVGILFSRDFNPKIEYKFSDEEGRILILQVKRGDNILSMVNLYAPTQSEAKEQNQFLGAVDEALANIEVHSLLLGGDLNVHLDRNDADQRRRSTSTASYIEKINALMEDYNLGDVWRAKNPSSTRGTFHRGKYSARLDYWFIPSSLFPQASIKIIPQPLSDHCQLSLKISFSETKRGPGYWRFDNSLLSDPDFVTKMNNHLAVILQERLSNPHHTWEWIKFKIRSFCIQFSIEKNRKLTQQVKDLEKRLNTLSEVHDLTSTPDIIEETRSIKRELTEIHQTRASAAMFRARTKWTLQGEKPTAYFLGLEKRRSKDNTITSLLHSDGHTVSDNKEILEMEREFFSKILTEDPSELDSLDLLPLHAENVPTISGMNRRHINRPFTIPEFYEALKDLNRNKTPGTDGITPEFYITFWDQIKEEFMESFDYSCKTGSLTKQQRSGVITLIPKKDLDRQQLTNWRPITLLNSDTKIISKALAKRIQSCVQEVVSEDQTGFIRRRCITSNLLTVQSLIDYSDETSTKGLLLALDYSKAFDMVRWELIDKALHLFGFGELICSIVSLLFNNIQTCVSNAGFSSDPFYPSRGIRQGCCASPVLFVLAVELLAILVRQKEDIKGISVAGKTVKVSQYADDATFFLQDTNSLHVLMQTLTNFSRLSGLKINTTKSHLLLLGNHKDPPTAICGIQVVKSVKILGMTFKSHMTKEEQYTLNFAPRIRKIKQTCANWINRNMSLKGKVTLINALLISVLQYPCSCTFVPERVFVEYKSLVTDFLWDGKRSKIAYNLLIQRIEDGGLKLADLETRVHTIRLGLIKKIWLNPDSSWVKILQTSLLARDIRQVLLFKANLVTSEPTSYHTFAQILGTWERYHRYAPQTEKQVQEEILWNNREITISRKPFSWSQWKDAGIMCINDLLHRDEARFSSHEEISAEFNINCSFLQLLQLRSAIPCKWKRLLLGARTPDLELNPLIKASDGSTLQILEAPAKRIYAAIIPFKLSKVTSQGKWNEIYPTEDANPKEYWKGIYTSAYRATRESKLQAFQYKIIHRTIPCNRYLHNIRIKQEDHCSFCIPHTTDSLQHFFFSCPITKTFWTSVCRWLAMEADFHINLDEKEFLFGVPSAEPNARSINYLALLAKHFIYRQKLFHRANMELTHFLRDLRNKLAVEKLISVQENKPGKFRRWSRIYSALG